MGCCSFFISSVVGSVPGSHPFYFISSQEFSHLLFFWCVCVCVCVNWSCFHGKRVIRFFCFLCFLPYCIHPHTNSFIPTYLCLPSLLASSRCCCCCFSKLTCLFYPSYPFCPYPCPCPNFEYNPFNVICFVVNNVVLTLDRLSTYILPI